MRSLPLLCFGLLRLFGWLVGRLWRFLTLPFFAATGTRCENADWVVVFTTLFNAFVLGLDATVEDEQYSVEQLTELPFSRCCWSCLKPMYGRKYGVLLLTAMRLVADRK